MLSLRTRLALLFAAATAVLAVLGGLLIVRLVGSAADSALDASLVVRGDALAQQVTPDGMVQDFQDGTGVGSLIPPGQAIAQVVGPNGKVMESSDDTGPALLLTPDQLAAARTAPVALTSTRPDGRSVRLLAQPVTHTGNPPVVVVVGAGRDVATAALEEARSALRVAIPLGVVASGLGAWLLAGAALAPVERMRAQAARMTVSGEVEPLPVPRRADEIGRLGRTINDLLARLHAALAQQRAFVADAAHELRTPLATLRAELELAQRPGRDEQALREGIRAAAEDTERLTRLTEQLLTLARAERPADTVRFRPVPLGELARQAAAAANARAGRPAVTVHVEAGSDVLVRADSDQLRQVLDNVVDNALHASPEDAEVCVQVSAEPATGRAVLTVDDRGSGFAEAFLPRAFDRFTRADESRSDGSGSGLGLSIVAAIVRAHQGTVSASNRPDGGARVRVVLPTAPEGT